jgi:hypothetical protein
VDVARTLILPDLTSPAGGALATLALFWESIELPIDRMTSAPSDDEQELVSRLLQEGILRLHPLRTTSENDGSPDQIEAAEVARTWSRTPPGATPATVDVEIIEEIAVARARRVARCVRRRAEKGIESAEELWAAPVVGSHIGFVSSTLPAQNAALPVVEGTLIHVAASGAAIDPATPIDDVLSFRDRHQRLAARLRASLIDLSSNIRADLPISAVMGQVEAVIKNRVEPALAALETELRRGRISFAWSNMFGVGGIVATGMHPAAGSLGGGAYLAGRAIKYAFDRDALVRDHPFGYLHRVRTSLLAGGASAIDSLLDVSRQPMGNLESLFEAMYLAAIRVDPRDEWVAALVGERVTDPLLNFEATEARRRARRSSWWVDTRPELSARNA